MMIDHPSTSLLSCLFPTSASCLCVFEASLKHKIHWQDKPEQKHSAAPNELIDCVTYPLLIPSQVEYNNKFLFWQRDFSLFLNYPQREHTIFVLLLPIQ